MAPKKHGRRTRGRPKDPERRARRAAELRGAALALFLKHGVEGVTIDRIVGAAGHAKGSFYRHFRNKEALVADLFRPVADQLSDTFGRLRATLEALGPGADVRPAFEMFAGQVSLVLLEDTAAARLYLQERSSPAAGVRRPIAAVARRVEEEAIATTELAQRLGLVRPGDATTLALCVVGTIERVLHAFLSGRITGPVPDIGAEVTRVVLTGIAP